MRDSKRASAASGPEIASATVPVIAEEITVDKRQVQSGGVRVNKTVSEHDETVTMPLVKEHLDVRRVAVGRDVDSPPPVRHDGDTMIVSVVEEVLVVEKRLRLVEELHITRRKVEEIEERTVTLRRENATVERLDADGRILPEQ